MTSPFGQSAPPILVAEDDAPMSELLQRVLERAGFRTVVAADGAEALQVFFASRPQLVLLDLHLPELDGWNVLQRIREVNHAVPIIMLTGSDDETTKIRALSWGADDYIVKPAGAGELLARVKAVIRRATRVVADAETAAEYADHVIRLDFQRRAAWVCGTELNLSPLEFRLLACFVRNRGRVLTKHEIVEQVWHYTGPGNTDHLKIYVGYLRRKIREATELELIETIRGQGYCWSPPADPIAVTNGAGH